MMMQITIRRQKLLMTSFLSLLLISMAVVIYKFVDYMKTEQSGYFNQFRREIFAAAGFLLVPLFTEVLLSAALILF